MVVFYDGFVLLLIIFFLSSGYNCNICLCIDTLTLYIDTTYTHIDRQTYNYIQITDRVLCEITGPRIFSNIIYLGTNRLWETRVRFQRIELAPAVCPPAELASSALCFSWFASSLFATLHNSLALLIWWVVTPATFAFFFYKKSCPAAPLCFISMVIS